MVKYIIWIMNKCNITSKMMEYLYYLKRKIFIKKINNSLLNNIEWIEEFNIPLEWFYMKKPKWISWVARLKNADYFLEFCMESHLPYLDELILVDNWSCDRTKEICINLKNKHPDKIKFYEYPYSVFPPSCKNWDIPSNSVHSLAYYYNWCFSKTKYSHVMKVDDDNFLLSEKWNSIRKAALDSSKYCTYRWINLAKDQKWRYWIFKWCEYSWKFWDHGIYPVSPYTYFVQWEECEIFVNNLNIRRFWFSFFHLKFLKPSFWFHNINDENIKKKYEPNNKNFVYLTWEFYEQLNKSKINKNLK